MSLAIATGPENQRSLEVPGLLGSCLPTCVSIVNRHYPEMPWFSKVCSGFRMSVPYFCWNKRFSSGYTISQLLEQKYFAELLPTRSEKYFKMIETKPFSVYVGVDPSASSMQLGNMVALMGFLRCHASGKSGIIVLGTSTVCVGDPSGRTHKRTLKSMETYHSNADLVEKQLQRILKNYFEQIYPVIAHTNSIQPVKILRNNEWLDNQKAMNFLTEVTSHFRIPELLDKESVKLRLSSGNGMDLSEFLYPVIQAMDFLHLYKHFGCRIQVGGQDQLGNITCGLNLIHRKLNEYAFGLTVPLLTTPDGQKFGKSGVSGAEDQSSVIWLSPEILLPYSFYQKILNLPDSYASELLLKQLTFLPMERIKQLCQEHEQSRDHRPIQRALAREVTLLVHGADGLQAAELATRILFPRSSNTPRCTSLDMIATSLSSTERNYLLECLSPTARLLPVLHLTESSELSTVAHKMNSLKQIILRTGNADRPTADVFRDQAAKGVVLNDVVIFPPGNASGQIAMSLADSNAVETSQVSDAVSEAFRRRDPSTGISILKIGKHERWFVMHSRP